MAMMASALLVAGEDKAQSHKAAAKTTATVDRPAGVPADAQEIQPYLYRYTDAQGKKWLYRQTPFGLSKWEDKPVDAAAAAARAAVRGEPLRETSHAALIRVFLAEGNVSEAVREFTSYQALLRDELGLEPTRRLCRLIQNARNT